MKKLLIAALVSTAFVLVLPLISVGMTEKPETEQTPPTTQGDMPKNDAALVSGVSYDEKMQITLLHGDQVITLALGDYLMGVVAAEMPASFPQEALKAQAIAARTYTLYKLKGYEQGAATPDAHKGAQLCDDFTHCKAYIDVAGAAAKLWGSKSAEYEKLVRQSVTDTDGMVVTYQGEPVAAVFHSSSSGKTENAADVWGTAHPYLVAVDSPGEEACPKHTGEKSIVPRQFAEKFWEKHPEANFNDPPHGWFKDSNRSATGGIINVSVGGVRVSGNEIRTLMGLNSTNFKLQADDNALTFSTTGYGHGVGMSQYGARELALEGKSCTDILKWYYQGTQITLKN